MVQVVPLVACNGGSLNKCSMLAVRVNLRYGASPRIKILPNQMLTLRHFWLRANWGWDFESCVTEGSQKDSCTVIVMTSFELDAAVNVNHSRE